MTFAIAMVPSSQAVSSGRPAQHPKLIGERDARLPPESGGAAHCITDKVADPHFSEYFHDESPKKLLPQGVRLIVHEAGHAVSLEKWRRAAVNYKAADPGSRIELGRQGGTGAMEAKPIKENQSALHEGQAPGTGGMA
jgi:hypothetical protein